ncbi:MFS transporter [Prosthecomicrobium sp. N25]|uniref:MFS transporter n=1 Tax=Prosthecomicrobium sp. N25 TaxID=3129254 RepID=UPI003077C2C7
MTTSSAPAVPADLFARAKPARVGCALLFMIQGLVSGGWVPHIPLAKAEIGVGTGVFGWILLAAAGGAVAAMPVAGALINRFGSAAVNRVAGVFFCLSFLLPILAATPITLAIGLALFGAGIGVFDVAMNAHGIAVEREARRAIMSSFHGWYSVGAAAGAGLGSVAVALVGETAHALATAAGTLGLLAYAAPRLLPAAADRGLSGSHFGWPTRATVGLGALCFLALMIEGAMLDWTAIHLSTNLGASVALAGWGFAAFQTGMAVTRFLGDGLRMRFGSVRLVGVSASGLSISLAAAIALPWPAVAVLAFGVAGLAIGNLAPVLFAGGARLEPDAPGRGIAAVTTMGYTGFLVGPPTIGMLAEATGLRLALGVTVLGAVVIALGAKAAKASDSF